MHGLSDKSTKEIKKLIHSKFDWLSLQFLGLIPKIKNEKRIAFSTSKQNIISLFIQSLDNKEPDALEEQVLKKLIQVASGYIDALKERTASKIVADIDSYITNQTMKDKPVVQDKVREILGQGLKQAKNHFKLIANSESNKAVNVGTALQISKIAESKGEEDPTVFFIVTVDDVTGPEEFRLHLLPDRKTPRVWKLSDIGSEYHKKGENNPKLPGLHPNCFVGNQGVRVLTEKDGYKNIKDIKIGDRVLTHTGKFKQVINTLDWYSKKYYGQFVEIKYKTKKKDGDEIVTLKVTPDHKFLTNRGWVEARELTSEDKLQHLYSDNGNYFFEDHDILAVETVKNGQGGYRLYDLTVEDDESFVVNGVVSHNCRCRILYISQGWGFSESGHVKYIGPDHDEYVYQMEKYGKIK